MAVKLFLHIRKIAWIGPVMASAITTANIEWASTYAGIE
jgi:hypothetical protein